MPWFLILPLLNSISTYLLVKPFYGINTFWWKHKIFNDVIFKKYLGNILNCSYINMFYIKRFMYWYLANDLDLFRNLHKNISEYYLGKWSNSRLKKLNSSDLEAYDRLVPQQPIVYEDFHSQIRPRYNLRKLIQLPYHLVNGNLIEGILWISFHLSKTQIIHEQKNSSSQWFKLTITQNSHHRRKFTQFFYSIAPNIAKYIFALLVP